MHLQRNQFKLRQDRNTHITMQHYTQTILSNFFLYTLSILLGVVLQLYCNPLSDLII